jgi:hypothetical protein
MGLISLLLFFRAGYLQNKRKAEYKNREHKNSGYLELLTEFPVTSPHSLDENDLLWNNSRKLAVGLVEQ